MIIKADELKNNDEGIIYHWVNQPDYIGNTIKLVNNKFIMTDKKGFQTKIVDIRYLHRCEVKLNRYIIEIDGIKLEVENKLPKNGELYIAERNIGPQLLTAKEVDTVNNWIVPVEFPNAYVYNISECNRVVRMI